MKNNTMKKLISLPLFIFLFSCVFAQVNEKKQTNLDIIFQVLEESDKTITKDQIINLLDSLDQENIKNANKEKNTFRVNEKGDTIYSVGDKARGGIVFWVDETGCHGLVVAEDDQASEVTAYQGKTGTLKGDSVYAGKYNAHQIIKNKSVAYSAALICDQYRGGGYNDWYLPSKYELNLLYIQYTKKKIGYFMRDYYWSSSEEKDDVAWLFRFYDGQLYNYPKYGSTAFRVRAIRAF